MLINLLNICFFVMAIVFLAVIKAKGARYAINENGYLERIQHDKLPRHAN
jgi:hypothetical protein